MSASLKLELSVAPEWHRIEAIRDAVGACVSIVCSDGDQREALAMTAVELTENAIKYGPAENNNVCIALFNQGGEIVVEVSNSMDGAGGGDGLAKRLAWLRSFPSPAEAYAAALQEVGTNGDSSGLGLARIAYEASCNLSVTTDEDRVTVRARHAIGG